MGRSPYSRGCVGMHGRWGYAMAALHEGSVIPWHRVINSKGMVSRRSSDIGSGIKQRILLEGEGVSFDVRGAVLLDRYQWRPRARYR